MGVEYTKEKTIIKSMGHSAAMIIWGDSDIWVTIKRIKYLEYWIFIPG